MSIDNLLPDDEVDEIINSASHISVQRLIDEFGEGAVRRGIKYMGSLDEAERRWKDSATESDEYGKKFVESVRGEGDYDNEAEKMAQSDWEEGMEDGGLGIDE